MTRMSDWGRSVYGDPCRECGFGWSIAMNEAIEVVRAAPARYAQLFDGRDGSARIPELDWSSGAYACHVVDNLCIWAERLAGAARGGSRLIAPYDSDLLARARGYEFVPIEGSLWSLGLAARAWQSAVDMAVEFHVVLDHPERGAQSTLEVIKTNTHDLHHHGWDIGRIEGLAAT